LWFGFLWFGSDGRGSLEKIIKSGTLDEWKACADVVKDHLTTIMTDKNAVHRLCNLISRWEMAQAGQEHYELVKKVLLDFPSMTQEYLGLSVKQAMERFPATHAAILANRKLYSGAIEIEQDLRLVPVAPLVPLVLLVPLLHQVPQVPQVPKVPEVPAVPAVQPLETVDKEDFPDLGAGKEAARRHPALLAGGAQHSRPAQEAAEAVSSNTVAAGALST